MNIVVIGGGYVGLVTGTCLADIGHRVTIVDINEERITELRNGYVPIYEPGLEELIVKNVERELLAFDTKIPSLENIQFVFIAVGTPQHPTGHVDCNHVFQAAHDIAQKLAGHTVVVIKSTVPPGTAKQVKNILNDRKASEATFSIVSNPEFLKEGDAVRDFMKPDRIIIGTERYSNGTAAAIEKLYQPILRHVGRVLVMSNESAELAKYATNGMLATRVSFMNEMSRIADAVGADIDDVRQVVGSDSRIGDRFLFAGPGWGGSCWPKDIKGLVALAEAKQIWMPLLSSALVTNQLQTDYLITKIPISNKIAIWGLAFKPGTNDTRESPTLRVIDTLAASRIAVYDPKAYIEPLDVWNRVEQVETAYEAAKDADCLLLMTEWSEFKHPNWTYLKQIMAPNATVLDSRNLWDPDDVKSHGFKYVGMGRS